MPDGRGGGSDSQDSRDVEGEQGSEALRQRIAGIRLLRDDELAIVGSSNLVILLLVLFIRVQIYEKPSE